MQWVYLSLQHLCSGEDLQQLVQMLLRQLLRQEDGMGVVAPGKIADWPRVVGPRGTMVPMLQEQDSRLLTCPAQRTGP